MTDSWLPITIIMIIYSTITLGALVFAIIMPKVRAHDLSDIKSDTD